MKNIFLNIAFLFLIAAYSCKKDDAIKLGRSSAIFNSSKSYGTVKDIDGNVYKTITIGSQTWMAENLRTAHYQNGDSIDNVKGQAQWEKLITGAWCTYNNTINPDSIATFGFLYNGYAVLDSRNIAPAGWHVPTTVDWDTLVTYVAEGDASSDSVGNNPIAGGRLKEAGTLHWGHENQADNSSGFTALPGGLRYDSFLYLDYMGIYWTSILYGQTGLLNERLMGTQFLSITIGAVSQAAGTSVRCIKNK